jgi:anti-anti-sigma factor
MEKRITLGAEQTLYQAASLHQQLREASSEPVDLVLDLSQVCEMDCAAAQILLWLQARQQQQQVTLRLCKPSQTVRDFIRLMGLSTLQTCLESDDGS